MNKARSSSVVEAGLKKLFLLVVALPSLVQSLTNGEPQQGHRVFPAAQRESYSHGNEQVLGIVNPSHLSIDISGPGLVDYVLGRAIHRFQVSLGKLPDYPDDYKENPKNLILHQIDSVQIHVQSPDLRLYHGVQEGYNISINTDSPTATLYSPTVFGALHGLQTLGQLFEFGWLKGRKPFFVVSDLPLVIQDEPHFGFRGLMIDTGRHYLPMELILDNLDAMAMNKMNVLHWHLVDSQSFPYQSESHPEVAEKGAYRPELVYTTEDIQTVVNEAYMRGIRVIPEVDLPGHTDAIAKSHPELMAKCPLPASPVDPTNPDTFQFVDDIYRDLDNLFPDRMVHVGGDEVPFDCWSDSKNISKWMKVHNMSDPVELYEYFETKLLKTVNTYDKTPIVWQEVFNLNLTLTKDSIVDVWKGFDKKTIEDAVSRSFRVVLSGCWYLDHLNDKWEDYYRCDPRNFTGREDLMIGGHASMWGEHVDASNFISRVWPRASATAERLWTGDVETATANVAQRMHQFRCRMVQQGFNAGPTGPGACPHEVPYNPASLVEER